MYVKHKGNKAINTKEPFSDKYNNTIAVLDCDLSRKEVSLTAYEYGTTFNGKDTEAMAVFDAEQVKDLIFNLQTFLVEVEGKAYDYNEDL